MPFNVTSTFRVHARASNADLYLRVPGCVASLTAPCTTATHAIVPTTGRPTPSWLILPRPTTTS
eukprot:4732523-Pleurochrysis_carterae.AAC.1